MVSITESTIEINNPSKAMPRISKTLSPLSQNLHHTLLGIAQSDLIPSICVDDIEWVDEEYSETG